MRTRTSLSVFLLGSALVYVACGGATKPPTNGDTPADSASATSSSTAPSTSASATSTASPNGSASAVASATPAPSASAAPMNTGDPCADVSAPYEAKVRPDVKKCFFDAMAKRPDLDGHIRITAAVNTTGKIGNVVIQNDKVLGKDLVTCMTNAVKAGGFDGPACSGKSIVMNMAFGAAARN